MMDERGQMVGLIEGDGVDERCKSSVCIRVRGGIDLLAAKVLL